MAIDKFLIEASHIMMFARSIGDDNPIYYDEDHKSESGSEGIIAPPTFAQSSAQSVSYTHLTLPTNREV